MRSSTRCILFLAVATLLFSLAGPACAEPGPTWLEPDDLELDAETPTEAPTLLSPENGTVSTGATDPPVGVPSLTWSSVEGAVKYHVQVSASSGFATTVVDRDTYATSYTSILALTDGIYYWRVKAGGGTSTTWGPYSEIWEFTKDWCDEGTIVPQLLSPPEDATRSAFQEGDFTWTPVTGTATYRFEIATDDSFSNVLYEATTIKPQHTPDERPANNDLYWRVTPFDHRDNSGTPSAIGSFTFAWSQPPELISPDDDIDVQFAPRFSWTAVEAAKEDRLQIATDEDFDSIQSDYTTRNTDSTPVDALSNDQDYFWRVLATDYEGHDTPWSEGRGFRVQWHFAPQLLTPANNSIQLSYPFFQWTPVPGVERYQIQIDEALNWTSPMINQEVYNVTTYAHGRWRARAATTYRSAVAPSPIGARLRSTRMGTRPGPSSSTMSPGRGASNGCPMAPTTGG